jgi:TM2 domain-containing membrane protein YozV
MNRIRNQRKERTTTMRSPGTAAVLSFFLPGVGQIYNGRFLWAIFWFIVTPGLWIGSGGFLGWVCHLLSAFQAFSQAKKR